MMCHHARVIFDFHCHYSPAFFRYREYRMDLDRSCRGMDAHSISHAVLSAAGEYAAYANSRATQASPTHCGGMRDGSSGSRR